MSNEFNYNLNPQNTLVPLTNIYEEQCCEAKDAEFLVISDWLVEDLFSRIESLQKRLKNDYCATYLATVLLSEKLNEIESSENLESLEDYFQH
jgi:hypothetical protein